MATSVSLKGRSSAYRYCILQSTEPFQQSSVVSLNFVGSGIERQRFPQVWFSTVPVPANVHPQDSARRIAVGLSRCEANGLFGVDHRLALTCRITGRMCEGVFRESETGIGRSVGGIESDRFVEGVDRPLPAVGISTSVKAFAEQILIVGL